MALVTSAALIASSVYCVARCDLKLLHFLGSHHGDVLLLLGILIFCVGSHARRRTAENANRKIEKRVERQRRFLQHNGWPRLQYLTRHRCIRSPLCFPRRRSLLRYSSSIGIKYGKYCGVGYSGCPDEKPCDDLDACCMAHDNCVGKFGMIHVKCHMKFKKCLTKVQKSGKVGFSTVCPYSTAAPTMIRGMDLAIMLSQLGNHSDDL